MRRRRLAIVADSHHDHSSRFEECVRVHDWIAEDIAAREVDLLLHAGDVYERRSTPEERRAVAAWAQRVTKRTPMIIVRGNHDQPGDLSLLERLETEHELRVVEGAEVLWGSAFGGFVVGCLAWPTKASVLALGATSRAEGEADAGTALRNVLLGLGQDMDRASEHEPKVLLAHAMVRGSRVSTGQPLVGCDLEVSIEDLGLARAGLYALGHIHKGQDWAINGAPVIYPGSPRRTAFGELEPKGYVVAEFDGPRCVSWELVPTPCAPMIHITANWVDRLDVALDSTGEIRDDVGPGLAFDPYPVPDVECAEVRVRYVVESDKREAAKAAAVAFRDQLLAAGAANVKIEEEVEAVNGARAPEVARARTLADKLLALWQARRTTPPEQRLHRLTDKASQLEEVARAV